MFNLTGQNIQFRDAQQANLGFALSELTRLETEVYRIRYPELNYSDYVPIDFGGGEWIKSVTYRSLDGAGKAGWINGNAKDFPLVGMNMEQFEQMVYTAGIGYDYGYEEVNQARLLGIQLDDEKARIARRAYEEMIYNIALTGDTQKGMTGLFNTTAIPQASVAADGTGSSTLWANKTGDQIARDVNDALIGLNAATKTTELADTLILPLERMQYIAVKRIDGNGSTMTILQFLQSSNVYTAQTGLPLKIMGQRGMLTIGSGGTARMIAYRKAKDVLKMIIPMAHRFLPMQVDGLRYVVPGIFRVAGLDVRLPKAMTYLDGI